MKTRRSVGIVNRDLNTVLLNPKQKSQALPWEYFILFFIHLKTCPLCYINCNQLEIKFKSSSNWYCCKNITYFRSEQLFHVPVFNSEMCGLEEQQINTYRFSIFRRCIKTVKQHQMKMITSLLSNGPDECMIFKSWCELPLATIL